MVAPITRIHRIGRQRLVRAKRNQAPRYAKPFSGALLLDWRNRFSLDRNRTPGHRRTQERNEILVNSIIGSAVPFPLFWNLSVDGNPHYRSW